jgi:hypothetical protein
MRSRAPKIIRPEFVKQWAKMAKNDFLCLLYHRYDALFFQTYVFNVEILRSSGVLHGDVW